MPAYVCSLCQILFDATPDTQKSVVSEDDWFDGFCDYFVMPPERNIPRSTQYRAQMFYQGSKALPGYLITSCETMQRQNAYFMGRTLDNAEMAKLYGKTFKSFLNDYVALWDAKKREDVIAKLRETGAEFSSDQLSIEEFAKEFSAQFVDAVVNRRQKQNQSARERHPSYIVKLAAAAKTLTASDVIPELLPHIQNITKGQTAVEMLDNVLYDQHFILLHAEGGVGKSKLLKQYAAQYFLRDCESTDRSLRLTLYYPLVDLNGRTNLDQSTLIDYIGRYYHLNDEERAQLCTAVEYHRHSVVFLFDGLNEISAPEHQAWFIRQMEDLAKHTTDEKLLAVVTCRTSNMTVLSGMDGRLFTTCRLELTDAQKIAFFRRNGKSGLGATLFRNASLWHALTPLYLQLCAKLPNGVDQPTTITQLLYDRYHSRSVAGAEMARRLPLPLQTTQIVSLYLLLPALCDQLQREHNLVLTQTDLFDRIQRLCSFVKHSAAVRGLMPRLLGEISLSSEEIVRYLVEDALLEVDASDRYTIHEQRRDYFAAFHQRNLCKLVRETTNENTWLDTAPKALEAGFPFYVDIAQRKGDAQALFAMILRCEMPDAFTNFDALKQALAERKEKIEATNCASQKMELLEEQRVFLICMLDYARLTAAQELVLQDEMRGCLTDICEQPERWTQNWTVQYQTRVMIENCEYIRFLRENECLERGMQHAVALYRHVAENGDRIERLARNPLMFGFLNQAGKCVLRQAEDLAQTIDIHGEITRETFDALKAVASQEYHSKESGNQSVCDTLKEIIEQLDNLLGSSTESVETLYALARTLLTLSAYHRSGESLNLLGMMYEQIDVRDAMISETQRRESIRKAFLRYYLSSRIPHPRVQVYAVQKVVELCLKEKLCIGSELPETLADLEKHGAGYYFFDGNLANSEPTRKLLEDYILVLENCGMPVSKLLYGLYALATSKGTPLACLKHACAAPAPSLEVLIQYLLLSPILSEEDACVIQEKGKNAIEKLDARRNNVKRADRWYPTDRYLDNLRQALNSRLSASETDTWKYIKSEFDARFPLESVRDVKTRSQ